MYYEEIPRGFPTNILPLIVVSAHLSNVITAQHHLHFTTLTTHSHVTNTNNELRYVCRLTSISQFPHSDVFLSTYVFKYVSLLNIAVFYDLTPC